MRLSDHPTSWIGVRGVAGVSHAVTGASLSQTGMKVASRSEPVAPSHRLQQGRSFTMTERSQRAGEPALRPWHGGLRHGDGKKDWTLRAEHLSARYTTRCGDLLAVGEAESIETANFKEPSAARVAITLAPSMESLAVLSMPALETHEIVQDDDDTYAAHQLLVGGGEHVADGQRHV